MKKAAILALTMLALPAMAQDQRVSLVFDQTKHEDTTFSSGGSSQNLSLDNTTAIGLRYGITAGHFWNGALDIEGTIRPRSNEKDLKVNGVVASSGTQSIKLSDEYLSLGVGMHWTQVVDFGFMLEARQESMDFKLEDNGFSDTQRSSVTRPWLRAQVGYTFPTQSSVKPFVNIAYGFALAKKGTSTAELLGLSASTYSQNFVIDFYSRSVLPKSEISLEAGIRF
ncbi:MAG TPA: hypothetical protein VNV60_04190 [Holophagaceae bacterium]|nr:hypothetical protein [Holophagaceae bacterium]